MINIPQCIYLPPKREAMNWRSLNKFGKLRGSEFYFAALSYAQVLWLDNRAARSLLAIDRALYAELLDDEPILKDWPLPYAAVPWIIAHNDPNNFIGNPRVHYQHLADRVRGTRMKQKKWRAWACWYLVTIIAPDLPADIKHQVVEPSYEEILVALSQSGIENDVSLWENAIDATKLLRQTH